MEKKLLYTQLWAIINNIVEVQTRDNKIYYGRNRYCLKMIHLEYVRLLYFLIIKEVDENTNKLDQI